MYRTLLITGCALLCVRRRRHLADSRSGSRPVGDRPWWDATFLGREEQLFGAVTVVSIVLLLINVAAQLPEPTQWDFGGYYAYGLAGRAHANFYEPLTNLPLPFSDAPSSDFVEEVLNVGFPYPPPTMFLLWPFASLPYTAAFLVWSACNLLALFLAAHLTNQAVRRDVPHLMPFNPILALFCLWPPVAVSTYLGQSNAFVLLALAAAYRFRLLPISGAALALGVFVKPWVALLFLWPLSRRRWKVLVAGTLTFVLSFFLAVIAFGAEVIRTYFSFGFTKRLPKGVLLDSVNESLLSTAKRVFDVYIFPGQNVGLYVFFVLATLIAASTLFVLLGKKCPSDAASLSLLVATALLLYPHSLEHYSSALIFPTVFLCAGLLGGKTKGWNYFDVAFIFLVTAVCDYHEGAASFIANFCVWSAIVAVHLLGESDIRGAHANEVVPRTWSPSNEQSSAPRRAVGSAL
ncbi:MAG: glycosyltransferase family 87 protein [Bdellovibrionota bacterium]